MKQNVSNAAKSPKEFVIKQNTRYLVARKGTLIKWTDTLEKAHRFTDSIVARKAGRGIVQLQVLNMQEAEERRNQGKQAAPVASAGE